MRQKQSRTAKRSSSCGALCYIERAQRLSRKSDLPEHANGRRKRRTSRASSAAHSSSSRARLHKARLCDNTSYIRSIDVRWYGHEGHIPPVCFERYYKIFIFDHWIPQFLETYNSAPQVFTTGLL